MATNHNPTGTQLYHFPIKILNKSCSLCLYFNTLKINESHALMIVPIPKNKLHDIGLVDVSQKNIKKFTKEINSLFPKIDDVLNRADRFCDVIIPNGEKLVVHSIGNY